MTVRFALYYAPRPDDLLWASGCAWLGRDPEDGAEPAQPDLPGIAEITADARLYGFHATLKPPMALRGDPGAFLREARALAAGIAPFDLPPLAVADLSGFLALRETVPSPALQALADLCVAGVDAHRAPPEAEELARRHRHGLSPARAAMLARWGYPDVFGTWRFHMTLTRRLSPEEASRVRPAAEAHFAAALAVPRRVTEISLFLQETPGSAFRLMERLPLLAAATG